MVVPKANRLNGAKADLAEPHRLAMSKQRAIAAEGRAIAARPSLCLLLVVFASRLVAALAPAAAVAAEVVPNRVDVSATDPASSASEPQDSTMRWSSAVRKKACRRPASVRLGAASSPSPRRRVPKTKSSSTPVSCAGTPIGEGTLEEFEDESVGSKSSSPPSSRPCSSRTRPIRGESQRLVLLDIRLLLLRGPTAPLPEEGRPVANHRAAVARPAAEEPRPADPVPSQTPLASTSSPARARTTTRRSSPAARQAPASEDLR